MKIRRDHSGIVISQAIGQSLPWSPPCSPSWFTGCASPYSKDAKKKKVQPLVQQSPAQGDDSKGSSVSSLTSAVRKGFPEETQGAGSLRQMRTVPLTPKRLVKQAADVQHEKAWEEG